MNLFIIVLGCFLLFILGLSIGVLMGRKPIKGSCGGLNKAMGENCQYCSSKKNCKKNK